MELVADKALQGIDWNKVFSLDVSYTVDTVKGGRFTKEMAKHIAWQDNSVVRDGGGKILADYR